MSIENEPHEVAESLLATLGPLVRRIRQQPAGAGLSRPERTALSRLDRGGPASSAELAREEQIRPQSMGPTLAALQAQGLIERHPDPDDGRRVLMSITPAGRTVLRVKRDASTQLLADALTREFSSADLKRLAAALPLIERLARSI